MEHPTLPVISGLLLLTSAPLCYPVSLPTGQPQPNKFHYICYYIFWAQRKTALAVKLLKTYVSKIVLNVLFIVEVFENKSCILYRNHCVGICSIVNRWSV